MEGLKGKGEGFEHFPGNPRADVQGLGPCHDDHENVKDLEGWCGRCLGLRYGSSASAFT